MCVKEKNEGDVEILIRDLKRETRDGCNKSEENKENDGRGQAFPLFARGVAAQGMVLQLRDAWGGGVARARGQLRL